jgi:flavin reductase (DIM6/NTAB) family NADH-FMN oxidoreductase RutF
MDMFVSLGPQAFITPSPVMLVGTYDERGQANIMPAVWGGISCTQPPCLSVSIRRNSWTCRTIQYRKAFTVSIPNSHQAGQTDFSGLVSGQSEDKFRILGWTAQAGDHVDAPFVAECPVVLELLLKHTLDLGSHIQFTGEIMDAKVHRNCLNSEGLPDPSLMDALSFSPLSKEYYGTGSFVARAFAVGKTILKSDSGNQ